jgi:hypothetical protein
MDWAKVSAFAAIGIMAVGLLTLLINYVTVRLKSKAKRETRERHRRRVKQALQDAKWALETPAPEGLDYGPTIDFRLHLLDEGLAMRDLFPSETMVRIRDARGALFEADSVLLKAQNMKSGRRQYRLKTFDPLKEKAITAINEAFRAIDADC